MQYVTKVAYPGFSDDGRFDVDDLRSLSSRVSSLPSAAASGAPTTTTITLAKKMTHERVELSSSPVLASSCRRETCFHCTAERKEAKEEG